MNAGTAARHIDGFGGDRSAVGKFDQQRSYEIDAHRGAQLTELTSDSRTNAQDDDVEHAPHDIHQHRPRMVTVKDEKARNGREESGKIEDEQNQERLRD